MSASDFPDDFARPPLLARLTSAQWVLIDSLAASLFLVGALVHLYVFSTRYVTPTAGHPLWPLVMLYATATLPIAVRRRWPVAVLTIVIASVVASTVLGYSLAPVPLIAMPLYTVTMVSSRRRSLIALVLVVASIVGSIAVSAALHRAQGDMTFNVFLAIATWFVSDSIRTRRVYLRGMADQSRERQRRELERARATIAEERIEIAREVHDIVAHSLSVIAIQSGVGRHVIDTQPFEARKALLAIESTSREALDELRRVLGALRRSDDGDPERSPSPYLGDVDELIGRVRGAGIAVELRVEGEVRPLAQGIELSLYRIIQEALTNVVKHTDAAATAVRIHYAPREISLEVTNRSGLDSRARATDGSVTPREQGSYSQGHGIVGMRERARAFGGSFSAQPLTTGGFRVAATLPTGDAP